MWHNLIQRPASADFFRWVVIPLLVLFAGHAAAVDAKAAETLARQGGCLKCHGIDKKKEGPSLKEIAAKWRGKPDAFPKLTKQVTVVSKVKIEGNEEEHGAVKTQDPAAIKNLLEWLLAL